MQRRMSIEQYRTMDLLFFSLLTCVCESMIVIAATRWFPGEPYTLSLVPAVTALVMVRWGAYAAIPALAGTLALCVFSGAQAQQVLIYCAGNMLALALLPLICGAGWKRMRANVLFTLLYGVITALLMQLGRAAIALLLGWKPGACIMFLTTDVLSAFFAALVVWICRRLDGMLEEQRHYLTRIQDEMKKTTK